MDDLESLFFQNFVVCMLNQNDDFWSFLLVEFEDKESLGVDDMENTDDIADEAVDDLQEGH